MKQWIINLVAYWLGQLLGDYLPAKVKEGVISTLPKTVANRVRTNQMINHIQKTSLLSKEDRLKKIVRESGRINKR